MKERSERRRDKEAGGEEVKERGGRIGTGTDRETLRDRVMADKERRV